MVSKRCQPASPYVEALSTAGVQVILGSKSASRRGILTEMGVPHSVLTADIDEKAIRFEDPSVGAAAVQSSTPAA